MKRNLVTLITAICALIQVAPEAKTQAIEEASAAKPGPQTKTHGGVCCCAGCAAPVTAPLEFHEKA